MLIEIKAPRLARYFITTNRLNSNSNVTCEQCGRVLSSNSFSNRYSARGRIIILCPDCAKIELEKGSVKQLSH